MERVLIVGGGVFGATAALELRRRGFEVVLVEKGIVPDPLAASTDISKVVRMEYGADAEYMALGEQAIGGWHDWNARLLEDGEEPVYHETGVAMFCMDPMNPGGFEFESYKNLIGRGHEPERANVPGVIDRFPAWNANRFVDGFFHARGGYAESGRTVAALARWLKGSGVHIEENVRVGAFLEDGDRIIGVKAENGRTFNADHVVVAAGAWTSKLLPVLGRSITATGHPVFHLRPSNPSLFEPVRFPTYTADVARTGYYGFPLNRDGVVKVGVHALGRPLDADGPREVLDDQVERLRRFLSDTFPALARDPIVYTRLCLYADTPDEHFWIARHPDYRGLTVASGGSGHGFKFAPVLGSLAADAVMNISNPFSDKFAWRLGLSVEAGQEAARCHTVV